MAGPIEEVALLEVYASEQDEAQKRLWRAGKYIEAWRAGVLAQQARIQADAVREREGL